jgi:PleD family two-component response regulator
VRRLVVQPIEMDGRPLCLTVSIAVAGLVGADVSEGLRRADQALYRAKALGRDRVEVRRNGAPVPTAARSAGS